MARILFSWELGGGFGHLARFGALVRAVTHWGHEAIVVAKDLARTDSYFGHASVRLLSAPRLLDKRKPRYPTPTSFPQLLWNTGLGSVGDLKSLVRAWRNLFELIGPDAIVFDHSPYALLAARGLAVRRVVIGSGFFCPPDDCPMPSLRPWLKTDQAALARDEEAALVNMNKVLATIGVPPLDHFASLYADVDDTALTTFRELDHFPHRRNGRYWGAWSILARAVPQWPEGTEPCVFAYLKKFATLPRLLDSIRDLGCRALVYVEKMPGGLAGQYESQRIRFVRGPVDMALAAKQCDAAVLNGTHGTTIAMLLAGKPTLQIPTYLEQTLFARRVTQLGAGAGVSIDQPDRFRTCLTQVLEDESIRRAAERFAERYRTFNATQQATALAKRIIELAEIPSAPEAEVNEPPRDAD